MSWLLEGPLNWADWIIVAIVGISCLISVLRGFVKEAISLAVWVAAFIISMLFHESLAYLLMDYIEPPSIRRMVAIGILFVTTLIVGSLVNHVLSALVRMTGLSGTDRLLGMVFGFFRGLILVVVLVMFAPVVLSVEQDLWWQQSVLIPHLQMMEGWSRNTGKVVLEFLISFT